MIKKKENPNNFHRPTLLTIIAYYFLFLGVLAIFTLFIHVAYYFPPIYFFFERFSFLFLALPTNDPFTLAIIHTISIYNTFFIFTKDIILIIMFLLTGYLLIRMKRFGYYLGLFVTIFGLIAGTTYGFKHNPIEYLQYTFVSRIDLFGALPGSELEGFLLLINFLFCIFTPCYLIINRRLFKN